MMTLRIASMTVLAVACMVILCHYALAAELSDLPIGYLNVTDGGDGNINVQARCAPAIEVLREVVARTGRKVIFDPPPTLYVSLDIVLSVTQEDAVVRLAHAIGLECSSDSTMYHVTTPARLGLPDKADTSLTDEQLREEYLRHPQPERPSRGISGGAEFIFDGESIRPPYAVETHPKPNGTCDVTVNGLPVGSFFLVNNKEHASPKLEAGPVGEVFTDKDKLRNYVVYTLYPQLLSQSDPEQASAKTKEFLARQPIVEHVGADSSKRITVRFKGTSVDFPIFPDNYDLSRGEVVTRNVPPQDVQKQNQTRYWENALRKTGSVLLCGSNGSKVEVPIDQFRKALALVLENRDLNIRQEICLWSEMMGRDLASFLATNGHASLASLRDSHGIAPKS